MDVEEEPAQAGVILADQAGFEAATSKGRRIIILGKMGKKQNSTSTIIQNQRSTRSAPCELLQRISTQIYPRGSRSKDN